MNNNNKQQQQKQQKPTRMLFEEEKRARKAQTWIMSTSLENSYWLYFILKITILKK